jgi:hypothetical protein
MLFKVPTESIVHPDRPRREPVTITSNQVLKGKWHGKHARAREAARWIRDVIAVRPTTAAAARTFNTSSYLVERELHKIRRPTAKLINVSTTVPSINELWSSMTAADRVQLVIEHGTEILDLLDHVTAPVDHEDKFVLLDD